MTIYRHGDILFFPVADPKTENVEEKDSHIVAWGEATGHNHLLTAALGAKVAAMKGFDGKDYIRLTKPATLTHQEHKTLSIDPGTYEIRREQEHDYFEEQRRTVLD